MRVKKRIETFVVRETGPTARLQTTKPRETKCSSSDEVREKGGVREHKAAWNGIDKDVAGARDESRITRKRKRGTRGPL